MVEQSKIYKTLNTLSKLKPKENVEGDFTEKDLIYVRDMSRSLMD
jgi:hypothetical protein